MIARRIPRKYLPAIAALRHRWQAGASPVPARLSRLNLGLALDHASRPATRSTAAQAFGSEAAQARRGRSEYLRRANGFLSDSISLWGETI